MNKYLSLPQQSTIDTIYSHHSISPNAVHSTGHYSPVSSPNHLMYHMMSPSDHDVKMEDIQPQTAAYNSNNNNHHHNHNHHQQHQHQQHNHHQQHQQQHHQMLVMHDQNSRSPSSEHHHQNQHHQHISNNGNHQHDDHSPTEHYHNMDVVHMTNRPSVVNIKME